MFGYCHCAVVLIGIIIAFPGQVVSEDTKQAERLAIFHRYYDFPTALKGGRVEPRWMADGNSFWYGEDAPENTVFWKVDPRANTKEPLFQVAPLRKRLADILGNELPHNGVPFDSFLLTNNERRAQFTVENCDFELDLDSGAITPVLAREEETALTPKVYLSRTDFGRPDLIETMSPDGQWFVGIRDHNISLRSTADNRRAQITTDGIENYAWDIRDIRDEWWSPDRTKLVANKYDLRKIPSEDLEIARLTAHRQGHWFDNNIVTDLFIVDVKTKKQLRVDLGKPAYWVIEIVGWHQSELLFFKSRDEETLDLMAANTTTGMVRTIVSDAVSSWHGDRLTWVDDDTFIWASEKDGWNHLYLYEFQGNLIRQLTQGAFPIDRVNAVDVDQELVYFTAHADQRQPYRTQLYRVGLDGEGLKQLAENTGQYFWNSWQKIQFSPSKKYFVCNRSSPAQPPVVELKRTDGTLVRELSKVDRGRLKQFHWSAPDEFSVTAADGETNLYGLLYKPYDFNPEASYPVIDFIYGASHISVMERYSTFEPQWMSSQLTQGLAQLGYVVVVMDSRGTPGRSKRFHDVAKDNSFHDYVIPDHVAGLKQLAEKRSYIDLNRTGVFGASAGGNMTILAMLTAPDVFRVGIALDFGFRPGDHDPLLPKLAGQLKGKLLLVYSAQRESNEKMARALIDANKFFDALPLPGVDHSFRGVERYVNDAVRRYFDEHLK
jgi:dipeptidyl-peptidase-4